jgi:hypothetical protein
MNSSEIVYNEIGVSFVDAKPSNMFGWKCYKYKNKPFLFFDKNTEEAMVFKLKADEIENILQLPSTSIFNPGDKGKPMKNWVTVPFIHHKIWQELAMASYEYICKEVNNKMK